MSLNSGGLDALRVQCKAVAQGLQQGGQVLA